MTTLWEFTDQQVERDDAIAAVESNSVVWRTAANDALLSVARSQGTLTSDDVWLTLHRRNISNPAEPRAMGPVMQHGVREGWIAPTNQVRVADIPSSPNHRRPQRVYRSRIVR